MAFTIETLLESANLPDKARAEVPRVINRLLGETFLYQDKDSDKDDYYLVYRHRDVFTALFAAVGFNLVHNDYHRIFQVTSEFSYCRQRYRLDESLMIVVLRKLYEEQAEHLNLAKDPVVTIGEIREEYRTITGKERDLGIGQYEGIMRHLRNLGLVDTVDGQSLDVRNSETRIRLRGSVKMLLPVQDVAEMAAWVRRYKAKKDS